MSVSSSTPTPDASASEIVDVTIHDIAFGGDGVGRLEDGMTVFVPFTAIGDHLRVRLHGRQKRYARGDVDVVLTPGPDRVEPKCPHYGVCGGCSYQHLTDAAQIKIKMTQLRELLTRVGGFADLPEIEGGEPSPQPYGYRNKVALTLLQDSDPQRTLGYVGIDGRTTVPIQTCPLAHPEINTRLRELLLSGEHLRMVTMSPRAPLVLRHVPSSDEVLAFRKEPTLRVKEKVGEHFLESPAGSFHQVNPAVLDRLMAWVRSAVEAAPPRALVDAYCGSGLFSVLLGDLVEVEVLGIESDRRAAKCATSNAKRAGIARATYFEDRVEEQLAIQLKRANKKTESLLLLDPPRQGCEDGVAEAIATHSPSRILYISCNPSTLARDLKRFCAEGRYRILRVACFDMFPQTAHIESVVLLERVGPAPAPDAAWLAASAEGTTATPKPAAPRSPSSRPFSPGRGKDKSRGRR